MRTRTTADRVVEALATEGLLADGTEERALAVLTRTLEPAEELAAEPAPALGTLKLVEVVAYLGGALVLAAGVLFFRRAWDDVGDLGQVVFLAAVAGVLAVAGLVASAGRRAAGNLRRRLSGTLLTGAAAALGVTVAVAIEHFTDATFRGIYWPTVAGGAVVTAAAAAAYWFSSTAVGLVAMIAGALNVAANLGSGLAAEPTHEALGVGLATFAVAVVWLGVTELGLFDQRRIARSLGVLAAVLGAQVAAFAHEWSWTGYLLSAVVAGVSAWLYVRRLDWPYLAGAVVAVTLVVPEAISDWTEGSLGVVGGVLVAGITLLAASFAGYRLHRDTSA